MGGKSDFGNPGWSCSWFLSGCHIKQAFECLNVPGECPNQEAPFAEQGVRTVEIFPIGGVPGQRYKVTFRFSAIVEAKEYQGGTRDQGTQVPADSLAVSDTFYRDGEPTPSSSNVWQLTVFDNIRAEARHYFMNSFPPGQGLESEQHTFAVSFEKAIVIVGGGTIEHRIHAPNCRSNDNCGPSIAGDLCAAPRILPNVPRDQPLPPMYRDPADDMVKPTGELVNEPLVAQQPWHSQLGHLRVLSLEETNDPVSTNYE